MAVTVTKTADGWKHERTNVRKCTRVYWVQADTASELKGVEPAWNSTPSYTDWPSGFRVEGSTLEGVGNGDSAPYIGILTVVGTTKQSKFGTETTKVGTHVGTVNDATYTIRHEDIGLKRIEQNEVVPVPNSNPPEVLGLYPKADSSPLERGKVGEWRYVNADLFVVGGADGSADLDRVPFTNNTGVSTGLTNLHADMETRVLEYSMDVYRATSSKLDPAEFFPKGVSAWGASDKYYPKINNATLKTAGKWIVTGFACADDTDFDGTEILRYTLTFRSVPNEIPSGAFWNPNIYGAVSLTTQLG